MTTQYRGFTIEILPESDQYVIKVKRLDGSGIEHPDNPDYYDEEDDCIEHGKRIIDEFLDE